MRVLSLFLFAFIASGVQAWTTKGFIGYGNSLYVPVCAYSCYRSISSATLNCSSTNPEGKSSTDPDCYATDDAFLETLAYCMSTRCPDLSMWELEKFWSENAADGIEPKYTYSEALERVDGATTAVYDDDVGVINVTSIVPESVWYPTFNTETVFEAMEELQNKYGLVIFLSGVAIPVGFSLLRFLPFPAAWATKFNAWFVDAPLFGEKSATAIWLGLVQVPTRGQSFIIFYFIALNVILSAVNVVYANPNTSYPDDPEHFIERILANRFAILGMANMGLVFLYAGRNNILIWMTNWSHSTFLRLHRWIAAIAILQVSLHAIFWLKLYLFKGEYTKGIHEPFYQWGIVSLIGMVSFLPTSIRPIRVKFYEAFLAWHVTVAVFVVAGAWLHIVLKSSHERGYELWILMCIAFWAFDRSMRLLRLLRNGVCRAEITVIDSEYVRVTIPGVATAGHAYLYFPTLTWLVWENHPFSIASTITYPMDMPSPATVDSSRSSQTDIEKQQPLTSTTAPESSASASASDSDVEKANSTRSTLRYNPQLGTTFYVRAHTGATSKLRNHTSLPVLVESGYPDHTPLSEPFSNFPTLIAIAGGVGMTASLEQVRAHPGRAHLYWGCRTQALVDDVEQHVRLRDVEKTVFVGKRMDVKSILADEVGNARGRVCVVVSGPDALVDEVRVQFGEVVKRGKGIKAKLMVESFSW